MKINSVNNTSFKGYDVRPLKGFLMNANPYGIAREMQAIGKKEGFKVYSLIKGVVCTEGIQKIQNHAFDIWAQDLWTIVKNSLLSLKANKASELIKQKFNLQHNIVQEELTQLKDIKSKNKHIAGGNIFIVKGDNGDEVLVGKDELKKFDISEIMKMYSVDKVTVVPQMDFHLDMFIRPLDNKRILLADDNLTLQSLQKGKASLEKYISSLAPEKRKCYLEQLQMFDRIIKMFGSDIKRNKYAQKDDVEKVLKASGFELINVPGRLYESYMHRGEPSLVSISNYMNANVLKNKQGELVYITNKSMMDDELKITPELAKKIGYSIEDDFVQSLSQYIDKEHVYFIEGKNNFVKREMLMINGGGIHCICTEIPEESVKNDKRAKSKN